MLKMEDWFKPLIIMQMRALTQFIGTVKKIAAIMKSLMDRICTIYRLLQANINLKIYKLATEMKIILASQSPRRKQILERLGIPFEIIVPNVDESQFQYGYSPEEYAVVSKVEM